MDVPNTKVKIIHGVEVKFPFEPYQLQLDYMTKVIESLQSRQHSMLESPTGELSQLKRVD